jgi:hypothetical protein
MPHSDIVFTSAALLLADKPPPCVHCGSRMSLIGIKPVGPHLSKRVFECPDCDRAKDETSS